MKRLSCLILVLISAVSLNAEEKRFECSGRLKLFSSLFLQENSQGIFFQHDPLRFASKRMEVRLRFSGAVNERISYGVRFDIFAFPGDGIQSGEYPEAGFLGSPLKSEYLELNLYEAYIKVNRFLLKNLDFTVGKQFIHWGTADRISAVNHLAPPDFANFFSFDPDYFGEQRPQTALNFEYYAGAGTKLQLVWLLQRQISPLPYGFSGMMERMFPFPALPPEAGGDDSLKNLHLGLRLSTRLAGIDAALSYYRGNLPLPVFTGLQVIQNGQMAGRFLYPRLQAAGIDLAGVLPGGIGWWGEASLLWPQEAEGSMMMPIETPAGIQLQQVGFPLFQKSFMKYIIGADIRFGAGFYANLQFMHGFMDELGFSEEAQQALQIGKGTFFGLPGDYLFPAIEYKSPNETFRIRTAGIWELNGKNSTFAFLPEVEWRFANAFALQGGVFALLSGRRETGKFEMFRGDSLAFLGMKIDF